MSAPLKRAGETVLLTGATGYVGSVVAEKLMAAGYAVRGLTRSDRKATILETKGVQAIVGDVRDIELMNEAASGASAMIHAAAPNAPLPGESMEQVVSEMVRSIELLGALAATNDTRLIITSGVSMYGPTNGTIVDETAPPQAPPFAVALAKAEARAADSGAASILRLAVVYGRDQSAPMRELIEAVRMRGEPVIVDPANRLSVAHVDDLADLYLAILEASAPPPIVNGVGSIITWPEVMNAIARAAGVSGDAEVIAPDEAALLGGPAIYMAVDMAVSGELARQQLGWQAAGPDFESGLTSSA